MAKAKGQGGAVPLHKNLARTGKATPPKGGKCPPSKGMGKKGGGGRKGY